jgi:hypothetical protein
MQELKGTMIELVAVDFASSTMLQLVLHTHGLCTISALQSSTSMCTMATEQRPY